jgi:hypothetical protein
MENDVARNLTELEVAVARAFVRLRGTLLLHIVTRIEGAVRVKASRAREAEILNIQH